MQTDRMMLVAGLLLTFCLLVYIAIIGSNGLYLAERLYGASFGGFVRFMQGSRLGEKALITFASAFIATMISLLMALPVSYAVSRSIVPRWIFMIVMLPLMVAPAATGMFLAGFFRLPGNAWLQGLSSSYPVTAMIIAQVAVTFSFAVVLLKASFDSVSPSFEHVARTLGLGQFQTFCKVTLPMAFRGIICAGIVVFARAGAEWEALMMFVGGVQGLTDNLPMAIYLDWNSGKMEWVLIQSALTIIIAFFAMALTRKAGWKFA